MPCGKRQIFVKDFAKEWVGYAISLASIAIAKESLFSIAIAKGFFLASQSCLFELIPKLAKLTLRIRSH